MPIGHRQQGTGRHTRRGSVRRLFAFFSASFTGISNRWHRSGDEITEIAMATAVKDLKGISDDIVDALKRLEIVDNEQFVAAAATPTQRKELAAACGCDTKTVLQLANRADLARVKGVSGVYGDLLEQAGVDTVKELATRKPENLHAKIIETNDSANLTARPPTAAQIEDWVAQARELPKTLTY
jgi:predicted flap endonuclease-1-like 5' DNA nuclease